MSSARARDLVRNDPLTRALALAALALAVLVAAPAVAHKRKVSRAIKVEPTADRALVWVSVTVPPGRAKETLVLLADASRDGALDAAERARLERTLAVRALDGVALWVEGATRALERAELKLSAPAAADAPLELAILGSVALGPGAQRLTINVVREGDPLELGLLPGARPVLAVSRGKVVRGGVETVVGSPDRVTWTVAAAP